MQFRVSCFWGDFGVIFGWGGPIFGSPRAIFGVPRGVRLWGPPGFEVLGAPEGVLWCQKQHFLGAQRCGFGFLAFGVILGWGGPNFGSPRVIFGAPRGIWFWGPQDLRFWGHQGVLWCQTQHFLGALRRGFGFLVFGVGLGMVLGWGGPIFGSPRAIFGVPRCVPFQGPPGFEVFGGTRGFCGVKSSIFGGPRDVALGFLFLG